FPDEDQLLYQKALMYERLGRISASKDLFYELLEKQPLWAEVYNGFGYVLAENNIELELANDLLTRALAMDPESPYILDSFGWLQYRMGNLELAELYLKMAWDRQQQ